MDIRSDSICAAYTRHTLGRAQILLTPAPEQSAVGFWLWKGCGMRMRDVHLCVWQEPEGSSLAAEKIGQHCRMEEVRKREEKPLKTTGNLAGEREDEKSHW